MPPLPKLVVICLSPGVPREACLSFGRSLRAAVSDSGRRVAFVASADMAHRHASDGPYGFDPAAAECDRRVMREVRTGAFQELLTYDTEWLGRAFTDAIEPLLILHGLTEADRLRGEVISYEVPTYFGLLCAAFGLAMPPG